MSDGPANAPAGWYPVDGRTERYWNGNTWSPHVRPRLKQPETAGARVPGTTGPISPASGSGAQRSGAPETTPTGHNTGRTPRYGKGWVVAAAAVVAFLVGIVIGIGMGVVAGGVEQDPTTTSAYKSVAEQRDETKRDLKQTKRELDKAKVDLKNLAGDIPKREKKLKAAKAALDARERKIATRESAVRTAKAAVLKRERKVGIVERRIAANTIGGEGIYEVGEDMKAGTYRTAGASSNNCYYAVLGDANGNDIKSNNNTTGPAIVSVRSGEYFQTSGCENWIWSR